LLADHSKVASIQQDKVLKSVQDKVSYIFGPLWTLIEEERRASSNEDDPLHKMTKVFEQTVLVSQAFNSLSHHQQSNILHTLIDNPARVKDILKGQ